MPAGSSSSARASTFARASPELTPGAVSPLRSAARVEVVPHDAVRAAAEFHVRQRSQRDRVAGPVAGAEPADVLGAVAVLLLRLHVHLVRPPAEVEVVDEQAAQIDLHRLEHLADRHVQHPGLFPGPGPRSTAGCSPRNVLKTCTNFGSAFAAPASAPGRRRQGPPVPPRRGPGSDICSPPPLPSPRTGGGGMTTMRASGISRECRPAARRRCLRRRCPPSTRSSNGASTGNIAAELLAFTRVAPENPAKLTTPVTPGTPNARPHGLFRHRVRAVQFGTVGQLQGDDHVPLVLRRDEPGPGPPRTPPPSAPAGPRRRPA